MEEKNTRRVKMLTDFFVDIFGALIPGILFLFAVFLGLVIPAVSMFGSNKYLLWLRYGYLDGWFWIVLFLVILLLGYVIGHIFYRQDINDVDKRSFNLQKKGCIRSQEREFVAWCRDKKVLRAEPDAWLLWARLGKRASGWLRRGWEWLRASFSAAGAENARVVAPPKYGFFAPFGKEEWKGVAEQIRRYFTNRIGMMTSELLYRYPGCDTERSADRETEEERSYRNFFGIKAARAADNSLDIIMRFNRDKNTDSRRADLMNYEEFYALHKFVFTEMDDSKNWNTGDSSSAGRNAGETCPDRNAWIDKIRLSLPADSLRVIDDYEKAVRKWLGRKYFLRFDRNDLFTVRIVALYFILYMQTEEACDLKGHCDFPYASYYKYLLRRRRYDLALLAVWNNYLTRSKISLNDYKLRIQVAHPDKYMIMIKNEAHIRMASSASYVYLTMRKVLWCVIAVVAGYTAYLMRPWICGSEAAEGNWESAFFGDSYMWIIPLLVLLFLWAIYRRIPKFLHYQRVREIFQVLHIYSLLTGNQQKGQVVSD